MNASISKCKVCQVKITKGFLCSKHRKFKLLKKCKVCEKYISDKNKTNTCRLHYNQSGSNNPMYGKSVYDVWIEKYGQEKADTLKKEANIKHSINSKLKWKNPEYRKLIKEKTTGLKRSEKFKAKQRKNAIIQMQDKNQRILRSKAIKQSFLNGNHSVDILSSNQYGRRGYYKGIFYASNAELERMKFLIENDINWKRYEVSDFDFRLVYNWKGRQKLYIPDFLIKVGDRTIIEEVKYDLKRITPIEKEKATFAKRFLAQYNIEYQIIDKSNHPI